MRRIAKTHFVCMILVLFCVITGVPEAAEKYPHYNAALKARESGDCDAVVTHLNAFLNNHPYVKERYEEFYEDVMIVIGQCSGGIVVRGVEDESAAIDPLPDHPPFKD